MMELSYRRHRFPRVVIQQAVWVYLRFPLNYAGTSRISSPSEARHLLRNHPELAC
jgi:transposase-like protein